MFKKVFLITVCLFIISFAIALQIDLKNQEKEVQVMDHLFRGYSNKDISLPLIDEEIVPLETPIIKESIPKIKKDINAISAESYVVGNLLTNEIYLEHNSNTVFPIASLSKLFTALVVEHTDKKDRLITINQSMLDSFGEAGNLVLNEKLTNKELLYPLLLESSNDAGEALAQSFGYSAFIKTMNSLAKEIGMSNTSFQDATGLSSRNISNASDLFILSKFIYKNEKELLDITRNKDYELATTTEHNYHKFISINPFSQYEPFIGGKTGRTAEAKESMISLFNYKSKNNASTTIPIAVIILRSDFGERGIDTEKILNKLDSKI